MKGQRTIRRCESCGNVFESLHTLKCADCLDDQRCNPSSVPSSKGKKKLQEWFRGTTVAPVIHWRANDMSYEVYVNGHHVYTTSTKREKSIFIAELYAKLGIEAEK